ncbi:helix-turn-helix transcriptional regulator [Litoreibacter albidus]|uniref:helix-turn-helix transcriptional regulator n=1 Tax=Litoreibacter albidus TaxID=670155 RepID=UPI003734DC80
MAWIVSLNGYLCWKCCTAIQSSPRLREFAASATKPSVLIKSSGFRAACEHSKEIEFTVWARSRHLQHEAPRPETRTKQSLEFRNRRSALGVHDVRTMQSRFPSDKVRDLRRFMDCLWIGPLAPQVDTTNIGIVDGSLLAAFEAAFLKQHCLRFHYRDAKGNDTERHVEPQALLILPPLWYLVAWDPDRNDFRHFRMDRITAPECLPDRSFKRRHVAFEEGVKKVRYA